MVNSLKLIETLVKVSLACATGPQEIPLMRFGVSKPIGLTNGSDKSGISLENLVEEFTVVDVETFLTMTV